MEITVAEQLQQLFLSCGLGFILGAYYDVFRVFRLVMRSRKWSIFFQDLFFSLSSAIVTFLFSLAVMNGHLRFYLFLGEGVGFAAYYFTIGRVVMRFAGAVTAAVVRVWTWLWRLIFSPFRLAARLLRKPVAYLMAFVKKILQKWFINLKKVLKRIPSLLYNHKKASQNNTSRLHRRGKKNHEGR